MEEKNNLVKDDLFELIQSLSKSEKRYFKIYASRHIIGEEKKSILLFDYLDKQSTYNHQKISDYCKSFIKMKQFSISKNRLYTFILSALDLYYAAATIEAQIYKLLHAFEILFRKSLYAQCAKTIQKAEKLAEKHGFIQLLPEIQKQQKRLFETKNHTALSLKMIDVIQAKDAEIASENNLNTQLWTVKSKLFYQIATKGNARTADEIAIYHAFLQQLPALSEIKGRENTYLFHHIKSACAFALSDFLASFAHVKILIELLEAPNKMDEKNTNRYIALLSNAIHLAEKLGEHNLASNYLQRLNNLRNNDSVVHAEDLQLKLIATTISIKLNLYIQRGEIDRAERMITSIKEELERFKDKMALPKKAYILFKIAVIHLVKGNYSLALKEINTLLSLPGIEHVETLFSHAQLLAILVHLELKHNDLLAYSLKNTQRYLKTRQRLFTFETVFLKNITYILKAPNIIDAEERWDQLFQDLSKIEYTSDELELFDFLKWAEAKKRNVSAISVFQTN